MGAAGQCAWPQEAGRHGRRTIRTESFHALSDRIGEPTAELGRADRTDLSGEGRHTVGLVVAPAVRCEVVLRTQFRSGASRGAPIAQKSEWEAERQWRGDCILVAGVSVWLLWAMVCWVFVGAAQADGRRSRAS